MPVRTKYEDNDYTPKYINRKSYKRIRIISIDTNEAIQHTQNLYTEYTVHSPLLPVPYPNDADEACNTYNIQYQFPPQVRQSQGSSMLKLRSHNQCYENP